ncbi:MAG: type II toxin-antitoxin system HicB family antitoxin [Thermomicrobiales bacterium]|jgi:predicted RNase H-like HicB family nuclease|nr:type II toxin-antitoxin system HicB family antitoxin [Thermomicrobiales bacterium]
MARFTVVLEHTDGRWVAYLEELPGANTQGKSLAEARENLQEATRLILAANREIARRAITSGKVGDDQDRGTSPP